jgi:hypothetical protein
MKLDQMVSIKVLQYNEDQLDILHALWKRHLRHDRCWHFFWEGYYTLIRCQKMFAPKVEGFLRYHKVKYEKQGVWIDNIEITQKFQNEFRQMFHSFSELAMKTVKRDNDYQTLIELVDRVCHCFLNNMVTNDRRDGDYVYWEPKLLMNCAIQRATQIGQIIERGRHARKSK